MDPTIGKGQYRLDLKASFHSADRYYGDNERATDLNLSNSPATYDLDFSDLTITYGWRDDMAVIVRSSHHKKALSSSSQEFSQSGVSSYYLGLRQRLSPGGDTQIYSETGVQTNQGDDQPLPLSSGGTDWFAILSYNQTFLPSRAGFEMDFGYVFRGGEAEDEVRFRTALKLDFFKFFTTVLEYEALESKETDGVDYSPLVWPQHQGYQDLGISLRRTISKNWDAQLSYHERLNGQHAFDTSGLSLGLTWWRG